MRAILATALIVLCTCHHAQGSGYTSSYKVHSRPVTWPQARRICLAEGAHLAIPRSTSESRHIGHLIAAHEDRLGKRAKVYAIGLYKRPATTTWRTVFGKVMRGILWGKGHPLRAYSTYLYASLCRHGQIKSFRSNSKMGFVCKKN